MDNYDPLKRVLDAAIFQAKSGKGRERHADDNNVYDQPAMVIARWVNGSPAAGPLFQAIKKARESVRMDRKKAICELYGAINYLGFSILALEEDMERNHTIPMCSNCGSMINVVPCEGKHKCLKCGEVIGVL